MTSACTPLTELRGLSYRTHFALVSQMRAALMFAGEETALCGHLYCCLKFGDGRIGGGPCLCGRLDLSKSFLFLKMPH